MIVRCGACRTQFDVPGEGRFACPVCGSVNVVRGQAGAPAAGPAAAPPGAQAGAPPQTPETPVPPPPPKPDVPSPRIECPECEFTFIIGDVAVVQCPNCGADVETGLGGEEEEATG